MRTRMVRRYRYKDGFRMAEARLVGVRPCSLKVLNGQRIWSKVVDFYAKASSKPPPGLMIRKSYGIILLDGFHRLAAAKRRRRLFWAWQVDWEQAKHLWPGGELFDDYDDLGSIDEYVLCDGKLYDRDPVRLEKFQAAAWEGI